MSEVLAVRGSDEVMRELAQTKASVIEAQRVLIVGAGALPKLLGELNTSLAELGYVCVPMEPAQGLYKTFADLLACPSLAPLLASEPAPVAPVPPPPSLTEASRSLLPYHLLSDDTPAVINSEPEPAEPEPERAVVDVHGLDMSKPKNWKLGDVFISNPRVTLPHKRRKWILDMLDVGDLDTLTGMDVQIRSPNTTTTELMTLKQFMAQYVFHERPAAEQSAAE
jgi:hypothetical protein